MSGSPPFSISARLSSVRCAVRGVAIVLRTQHNAWIHALATAVVCIAGLLVGLSRLEWCAIVLAVVAVWTAEALNTAIEVLVDLVSPARHPLAGKAKDVAAGAVLVNAIGAAVIGILVFGSRLLAWAR
jgi:diacylglycerol kinase (ATP)